MRPAPRWVVPFVLLTISTPLLSGCFGMNLGVLHELRRFAGPHAIDCGVVLSPGREAKDNACAVGASVEGSPFFVQYVLTNGDSTTDRGLAMDRAGLFFLVSDDPNAPGLTIHNKETRRPLKLMVCPKQKLAPDPAISTEKVLSCRP